MRLLGMASLFLLGACAAQAAPATDTATTSAAAVEAPAKWPVPAGWRTETIPFPLGFAPALPYHGVEELRFGPSFFKPSSPTYFTYTFAFELDGAPAMSPEILGSNLQTYFTGLMSAVTHAPSDPALHTATIRADAKATNHYRGEVHTIDGFGDKRALALHLEADTMVCGDKRIVLASLSPQPESNSIWQELAGLRAAFPCKR